MNLIALTRRTLLGFSATLLAMAALISWTHAAAVAEVVRRALRGMMAVALALVLLAGVSRANELGSTVLPTSDQIVIHDAAEVLRDWSRSDADGRRWLLLPGGLRFEFVTSVSDPAIANPGDGTFHPFDLVEVSAALRAVRYPLDGVAADVFILPYPCRGVLASAAGPGFILLSPGVLPLPRQQQHAEFVHELGHVVQYSNLPDRDLPGWDRYRGLRGIGDTEIYWSGACHADRPHEIFAEDFRALFGGVLANTTGSVENSLLAPPTQVSGLDQFILQLADGSLPSTLTASCNPVRGRVSLSRSGSTRAPLDIFDLQGRRLVTVQPVEITGGVRWSWDGRDERGARVGPGVVFARTQDGGAALRITMLD